MNKLMGFYELQAAELPAIRWKEYTGTEILDKNILWTVRTAIFSGNDLNLPRLVGESAEQAMKFADELLKKLSQKGIVIYYPYFIAKKSGTLTVRNDSVVVEAVKDDLWNLVTFSDREITIIIEKDKVKYIGNESFLSNNEEEKLLSYVAHIKKIFRDEIMSGESILIEWSFAYNCNLQKETIGEEYLVFYEMRSVL